METHKTIVATGGEMARRIEEADWSGTPLGARDSWPRALELAVELCLRSRFPTFVWWGDELINLYNDAYVPILAGRHPSALGRPARELWSDVWDDVRDQVEAVLERGESTWNDRGRLLVDRGGRREPAYFTWTFYPIPDDAGDVGGLMCTVVEETGRVRAEGELAEARRRLNSALIAGEVGTFEWDVAADRLWGDANFERLFGVQLDASGAAPLRAYVDTIHPEDRPSVVERIERTLETGEEFEAEYRIVRGGEVRWVVARGKAERGEAGQVARFPGVVVDITDRKAAEAALRSSEARYRALFEAVDEGFCILEVIFDGEEAVDYRFLEGNPAWERHTGLYGAVGRTAREVLPDLEEHWFRIYGSVVRTGMPARFESGSEVMGRWFDVYAFPFEPETTRVALLFKDITDQRRAAQAAQEVALSRARFRAVLEHALDAAYRRDLSTDRYDYVSPRVRQVLGVDPDWLRTAPVEDVLERIHPEDRDRVSAAIGEGVRSGRGRIEYRFRADDGQYRWLADHFTVQSDEDGSVQFRTGIVRDVSDQKRGEEELKAAKEAAEQASQTKSQFLAVMSHELRTPLSGVIGFTDLMESGILGDTTAKQQDALGSIKASAWHLIGIIDEILELSRAESGQETVRWRDADLAELTRTVVRSTQPQAAERGLTLECLGADEPLVVPTDPGKVRQILINLVGNAVKYTDTGRVTVRLDRSDPAELAIHVEDTGPGIDPREQERIFEPFTQVDASHTRTTSGTGLGLAICRRFARLLGGDVAVKSVPGDGSTFTLQLPTTPPG